MINISYLLNLTALLFLLAFNNVMSADDLQCPNNYTIRTTLRRLKEHTFCKYDTYIRPVRKQNDTVNVKLRLVAKRIDFDDKNDVLKIHSYLVMKWNDFHLMWNVTDFDNIDGFSVPSYNLWRPDFETLSSIETISTLYYYYTVCGVNSDGDVLCVIPESHVVNCAANLIRWPYDQHTCRMVVTSWSHSGEEINITLLPSPVMFLHYDMNREWELISSTAFIEVDIYSPNDTYPSAVFEFVIKRHSGIYSATITIPAAVLMMITLITFWMVPGRSDRLYIAVIDMFSHFLFLLYLGIMLPSNGNNTPLLVTFYRDSLLLATMALIMAIIGKTLETSKQPIPIWASRVSAWIGNNHIIQIILFNPVAVKQVNSEESRTDNEAPSDFLANAPASNWTTIIAILDMLCFIISLIVYIILIFGFMP